MHAIHVIHELHVVHEMHACLNTCSSSEHGAMPLLSQLLTHHWCVLQVSACSWRTSACRLPRALVLSLLMAQLSAHLVSPTLSQKHHDRSRCSNAMQHWMNQFCVYRWLPG